MRRWKRRARRHRAGVRHGRSPAARLRPRVLPGQRGQL